MGDSQPSMELCTKAAVFRTQPWVMGLVSAMVARLRDSWVTGGARSMVGASVIKCW